MKAKILLTAMGMFFWINLANAQDVSDADTKAIQMVITSQIEAFRSDDANRAYSFAAPNIKRIFPDMSMFMTMVKRGYLPVYRPKNFDFGINREIPTGVAQSVFLTGPDGEAYIALYSMQRQENGEWKINGVELRKAPGESA